MVAAPGTPEDATAQPAAETQADATAQPPAETQAVGTEGAPGEGMVAESSAPEQTPTSAPEEDT